MAAALAVGASHAFSSSAERSMPRSFLFVSVVYFVCLMHGASVGFVNASETTARFFDAPVIVQLW